MVNENINQILSKLQILYAEDIDMIRDQLATILERRVGRVITAENGLVGVERFKEFNIDMVITDIRMPIMDGLTMIAEIRNIDDNVPIIVTTAHNDEEFFIKSIDLNIDAYLLKPINPNQLEKTINKLALRIWEKREIERRQRFIETLFESLPAFILVINENRVEHINTAFLRFLGLSHEEQVDPEGKIIAEAIRTEANDSYGHLLDQGNWLGYLTSRSTSFPSIRLQPPGDINNKTMTFSVSWSLDASAGRQVFSFTDLELIQKQIVDLQKRAYFDPLTGAVNRARLYEKFHEEMSRSNRYNVPLSLLLIDVDHFKKVNDTYGHNAGDVVLVEVVRRVKGKIRLTDMCGRWGGEEFMVIIPDTILGAALEVAEQLRKIIALESYPNIGNITCSIGVAQLLRDESMHNCLERVDAALYRAKNNGRNRVEMAEQNIEQKSEVVDTSD